MSMPYPAHPAYPSPYQTSTPKKRPSWVWFLVGGLLMLAAVVVAGVTFGKLGFDIAHDDAVFRAGGTHSVTVPANAERGIFVVEGAAIPRCRVVDGSGAAVQFNRPDSRFTFDGWEAVGSFDTGDGNLTFVCHGRGEGGKLRIGRVPDGGDIARAGVFGFFVPLGVGGVGFVVVLITGILWFKRRPSAAYAAPPPGWQPPPPASWPPTGYPGQPGHPGQPGQPGQPGHPVQPAPQPGQQGQPPPSANWPPSP